MLIQTSLTVLLGTELPLFPTITVISRIFLGRFDGGGVEWLRPYH